MKCITDCWFIFRWLRRRAGYDGASIDISSACLNHSRYCRCAVGGVVSLEVFRNFRRKFSRKFKNKFPEIFCVNESTVSEYFRKNIFSIFYFRKIYNRSSRLLRPYWYCRHGRRSRVFITVEPPSVHSSVCPFVPSIESSSVIRRVCCWAHEQVISIDSRRQAIRSKCGQSHVDRRETRSSRSGEAGVHHQHFNFNTFRVKPIDHCISVTVLSSGYLPTAIPRSLTYLHRLFASLFFKSSRKGTLQIYV